MKIIKNNELKKHIKLVNYIFVLILIVLNFNQICDFFLKILDIFNPVIIAVILAFIINFPMSFIEDKLRKNIDQKSFLYKHIRLISYLLAMVLVIAVLVIIINLIVPELVTSIKTLIQNISKQSQIIDLKIILNTLGIDDVKGIDLNQIFENSGLTVNSLTNRLTIILASITGGAYSFITSAGGTLVDWMMGAFISLYLLLKKEETLARCQDFMIAIFPYNIQRVIFQYLKTYYRIFDLFVGKRLLESAILAIIEYIGCIIFSFPYAALIAVMTFVLSIIPYFGCLIAVVIGWVLILPVDFGKSILFIIIFEIITIFESNVIYPRVVGKSLGLPEVWTLIGLILFGDLWGFLGMLIAVPITACFYISITDFVKYRKNKIKEEMSKEEEKLDKDIEKIKKTSKTKV